jgi:hypothetical protein
MAENKPLSMIQARKEIPFTDILSFGLNDSPKTFKSFGYFMDLKQLLQKNQEIDSKLKSKITKSAGETNENLFKGINEGNDSKRSENKKTENFNELKDLKKKTCDRKRRVKGFRRSLNNGEMKKVSKRRN